MFNWYVSDLYLSKQVHIVYESKIHNSKSIKYSNPKIEKEISKIITKSTIFLKNKHKTSCNNLFKCNVAQLYQEVLTNTNLSQYTQEIEKCKIRDYVNSKKIVNCYLKCVE